MCIRSIACFGGLRLLIHTVDTACLKLWPSPAPTPSSHPRTTVETYSTRRCTRAQTAMHMPGPRHRLAHAYHHTPSSHSDHISLEGSPLPRVMSSCKTEPRSCASHWLPRENVQTQGTPCPPTSRPLHSESPQLHHISSTSFRGARFGERCFLRGDVLLRNEYHIDIDLACSRQVLRFDLFHIFCGGLPL